MGFDYREEHIRNIKRNIVMVVLRKTNAHLFVIYILIKKSIM